MPVVEPTNLAVKELKGLHLYHSGISNCSMRVRLTIAEKDLDWQSHHLDLRKKEHITEEYFGINPNGLVPTLVHDGKVIIESADIIDYLDTEFAIPSLRPSDPDLAKVMTDWVQRAASIHLTAVKTHIYEKRMRGAMTQSAEQKQRYEELQTNESLLEFHRKSSSDGFSRDELDAAKAALDKSFTELEQALDSREWLVGENFSLADIAWIPVYFTLNVLAGYSFDAFPNVLAWAARIESRPSYQSAVLDWWPKEMTPLNQKSA